MHKNFSGQFNSSKIWICLRFSGLNALLYSLSSTKITNLNSSWFAKIFTAMTYWGVVNSVRKIIDFSSRPATGKWAYSTSTTISWLSSSSSFVIHASGFFARASPPNFCNSNVDFLYPELRELRNGLDICWLFLIRSMVIHQNYIYFQLSLKLINRLI